VGTIGCVEITIGVQNTPRELTVDTEMSLDEISSAVSNATDGTDSVLRISDSRGRTVFIPGSALAYLEVGPETTRKVGFGSL